jgi:hypothetical protein
MTVALAQYSRWPANWNTCEHQVHTKQEVILEGDNSTDQTVETTSHNEELR